MIFQPRNPPTIQERQQRQRRADRCTCPEDCAPLLEQDRRGGGLEDGWDGSEGEGDAAASEEGGAEDADDLGYVDEEGRRGGGWVHPGAQERRGLAAIFE